MTNPPGAADRAASWSSSFATAPTSGSTSWTAPRGRGCGWKARGEVIILSSNNYLGLSNEPSVVKAGKEALDRFGAGTASVRFICGTFTIHRALEAACARLVGTPASPQLRELLERQRGRAGNAAHRRRPGDQRPAESRLDHRRDPPGQGHYEVPDRGVPARRPGRSRCQAHRRPGPPGQDGRHRRRLLYGRRHRAAARPDRALPEARGGAGGGRLSRHRRVGPDRARYRRALRRGGRGGHHHLDPGQGAGWRRRRICRGVRRQSATT